MQIGVPPTSIVGRYSCPYNNIVNTHWWNTKKSGGCIVEQATHFVDLIRHLSGADVVPESIKAIAVGADMRLSQMPPHPQAEHTVQSACVLTLKSKFWASWNLSHLLSVVLVPLSVVLCCTASWSTCSCNAV